MIRYFRLPDMRWMDADVDNECRSETCADVTQPFIIYIV